VNGSVMTPSPTPTLLQMAACLASVDTRASGASQLASAFGAEALLIFIRDEEVGALLSAPGFPQTLPNGKRWQAFLHECAEHGELEDTLPLRSADERLPSIGYAEGRDVVLVLIGTDAPNHDVDWFRTLLPLFAAVFRGEITAARANTQARHARESSLRASALAQTLDRTRRQLQDRAVELQEMNRLLRDQAEAMELQATELEAQADELQVANQAMNEARAAAEKANRAKSEFLATMSHELRTPLNAIGGHVQLLTLGLHGPVTDEQRKSLARIERSARHLLGLINDILNLSRIEAGRVEYVLANVPLSEALADLSPMIEPQLAAKSLAYEVRNVNQLPVVRADREKLQQILLNLLSNAVKFTDAGGRVWIDVAGREGAPGSVFVRVGDTGKGIPADKLETIFEPFTQVDGSHSRLGQGTGLGLSISRDLARGMGGDLRVRSELGKGSVFTLGLEQAPPF
jgi:signal transduction histidine kinase